METETEGSFADMGFAKLDTDRERRTGFPETVFCQGKEDSFLKEIFLRLHRIHGEVLGTRASLPQYEAVRSVLPDSEYNEVSGVITVTPKNKPNVGNIAVCTAGTADIKVAEEAALCAEFWGARVSRVYDVGVSGIHRLLSSVDVLNRANCIIAIAGMEGALASVIGGLVKVPVVAVPTSVGYGANLGGISALLTMINSCANGISVVNIDNGYGAAYIATQINRLAVNGRSAADGEK